MKTQIGSRITFLIGLLYSMGLLAQNKTIDSLKTVLATQKADTTRVNTLTLLSRVLAQNRDYDRAKYYANEALTLAEKINFKKGEGSAYARLTWIFYFQSHYPEAIKNGLICLKIRKNLNDKLGCATIYIALSAAYGMQGNYTENLKSTYASLRLYEELGNKMGIASQYSELANIYSSHNNLSEGLKSALTALKISQEIGDKRSIAYTYNVIGRIYTDRGNYTKALQKYMEAIRLYNELDGQLYLLYISDSYRGIGLIYEIQGELVDKKGEKETAKTNFIRAQKNYLLALKGYEKGGNKDFTAEACLNLGSLEIKFQNFSTAKNYFQKALQLSKEVGFKIAIRNSYSSLVKLDSMQANYKQAFNHYKSYIVYRDSVLNSEYTKKSVELKMQYEFDKKEAINKAVQEKKDVEQQRARTIQYFIIGSLLILVLVVLLIVYLQWRNNQHKQKTNRLLQSQKDQIESTLTNLKVTQTQLIQKEKMASLGELTAGIAHEIQNPLNFVNNFSEVSAELTGELKEELSKGDIAEAQAIADDLSQNLQKIAHHGSRASAIVKGMLEHSRTTTGEPEPTDLNPLVEEYLRLAYQGFRAKNKVFACELVTDFDPNLGLANVVPQEIGQVLLNLFNNAFYAVREKQKTASADYQPTLNIVTKRVGNQIEISVGDNGMGIPESVKAKIFQPFFTTKPTGEGTGLGLSLSYDITTKGHGGSLRVESQEGKGTTFSIQLPVKNNG